MNPRWISKTGVDGTTPVHSVISETYTPAPSDNSGTSINGINRISTPDPIGISAAPPIGGLWSPSIGNIRKSASPNIRESDDLNAFVYGKFFGNLIVPSILTQVFSDKLF